MKKGITVRAPRLWGDWPCKASPNPSARDPYPPTTWFQVVAIKELHQPVVTAILIDTKVLKTVPMCLPRKVAYIVEVLEVGPISALPLVAPHYEVQPYSALRTGSRTTASCAATIVPFSPVSMLVLFHRKVSGCPQKRPKGAAPDLLQPAIEVQGVLYAAGMYFFHAFWLTYSVSATLNPNEQQVEPYRWIQQRNRSVSQLLLKVPQLLGKMYFFGYMQPQRVSSNAEQAQISLKSSYCCTIRLALQRSSYPEEKEHIGVYSERLKGLPRKYEEEVLLQVSCSPSDHNRVSAPALLLLLLILSM
ncbi:hypothetical protein K435DRAFT_812454 [Dendrothele bispora CBS 962.96]|uniref:Uncharacterized protein n=1 Tax=Dendrothele bispora (strain CBS 962.96) TaxID=1314807 RepID=A0A4S8KP18_DENBC|nr:hypothetical protein K435DRAFT_812454 [Dendrothele bispora CBS 962.96]